MDAFLLIRACPAVPSPRRHHRPRLARAVQAISVQDDDRLTTVRRDVERDSLPDFGGMGPGLKVGLPTRLAARRCEIGVWNEVRLARQRVAVGGRFASGARIGLTGPPVPGQGMNAQTARRQGAGVLTAFVGRFQEVGVANAAIFLSLLFLEPFAIMQLPDRALVIWVLVIVRLSVGRIIV